MKGILGAGDVGRGGPDENTAQGRFKLDEMQEDEEDALMETELPQSHERDRSP